MEIPAIEFFKSSLQYWVYIDCKKFFSKLLLHIEQNVLQRVMIVCFLLQNPSVSIEWNLFVNMDMLDFSDINGVLVTSFLNWVCMANLDYLDMWITDTPKISIQSWLINKSMIPISR